ncbi:MAG: YihY/virulence factor BrkB family protein [Candidatus Omnitrophota bacterium]
MKKIILKAVNFLTEDIWRIRSDKLPRSKSFLLRQLRIIVLAIKGFDEDKCQLRAASLTFFTLLSIVPMVAMAFGVAKGFGFENNLQAVLMERFPGQEEVISRIIEFAQSLLRNTQGGIIAGVGVAILFWTVIKVLGNIENSFNEIWGVKHSRTLARKFSDYLSIMLIAPILLILSSSLTVLITSHVTMVVERIYFLGPFAAALLLSLKILPFVFLWILFTFVYTFIPNTRVSFRSGFLGGLVAGTIYQIVQWMYISLQIGTSRYGAIYGSFAALPLFLVWLQLSWTVLLFGAEISFAEQNVETYEFEPDCLKVSNYFKRLLALRITHLCVRNFSAAKTPWTAAQISHRLETPIRLVRQILFELTEAGVLVEVVVAGSDEISYQPTKDINHLTVADVMELLDAHGIDNISVEDSEDLRKIRSVLETFAQRNKKSEANILLKNLE